VKFEARPYQRYCITRLITDPELGLFLDMGLGKTVSVLTAINDLKYNRFQVSRVLVIAPKKVAESTWTDEKEKWDHLKLLRMQIVLGSKDQRIRKLNTPGDIWIINRENVPWLVDYYRNEWPFDMVVVDESSSFKSPKAKRFKSLTWVRSHIRRMVILTGTPAPNGLIDLWAQIYLLDEGKRLEKRVTQFRERYFEPDKRDREHIFSYRPKAGGAEVIQAAIGDICVSMKAEDYLDLPDCLPVFTPVVLDTKAQAAYQKLEKEMLLEVDGATIDAGSAAILTNKLLQLCSGAVYDEEKNIVPIHDCKIEAFLETVEALNGQPALVFYNFKHDVIRIKKALEGSGLRVRELKTPQDQADWNARKIDILLAHPASAAYGLNLQKGGNHVIWFSLNWSLELYQQANKRLDRPGQTERVIIHHLIVKGGMDEEVVKVLREKGGTQEGLMKALKVRIAKVHEAERSA
jgi:SNF2 family DNA or RNA helicase